MSKYSEELINIVEKFAGSGWDVIDAPSKAWLKAKDDTGAAADLIAAVQKADAECGSCGCEFDPVYKRALVLLAQ